MPRAAEIVAQPRQRPLMQEAGEIVGTVGHQLAAADADEQIEKFALDPRRVGAVGRFRETDMRHAERRRIAAQRCKAAQKFRVRRARQQRRQQRVFLRAREIDFIDAGGLIVLAVQIGPQNRASDAGQRFDRQNAFGRNARPIRHRGLGNPNRRASSLTPPAARIASWSPGPACLLVPSCCFVFWARPARNGQFRMVKS